MFRGLGKKISLIVSLVSLVIFLPLIAMGIQSGENITIGKRIKVFSKVLNEERTINVHLPEGYDKSGMSYPVLYILDAEWQTLYSQSVAAADYLSEFGRASQMISVGICNTIRNRDMIPQKIESRPNSGGSDNFLQFIHKELMPHISENYRTEPFNIIYGGSNAGLFVVYALLANPEAFDAYIAGSPMIGHCPDFMQEKAENFLSEKNASNKFLTMIYGKTDFPPVTKFVPDFFDNIQSKSSGNDALSMKIIDDEGHVPYTSLYDGLRFVFSGWPFPEDRRQEAQLDDIKTHYTGISKKLGFKAVIPLVYLLDLGIRMIMDKKDYGAAIEAMRYACKLHPYSPDAFYYMGLAYENNDELELALKNYKQALKIDPDYHMATEIIKSLEKK